MFKTIKYFILLNVLPPFIYLLLLLLRASVKIKHINHEHAMDLWNRNINTIVCFWHGRLLMMPFANIRGRAKVLISRHRDGEFIARVIKFFKIGTIRGSYRKKSISSIREIILDLQHGFDVAITPDGPKGPKYKVKEGIIELAKLTQYPIIPVTYSASKKKLFIPGITL